MKFLLVKSVFCPNYKYYEATIKSLFKTNIFIQLIKENNKITFDGLFVGYSYTFNDNLSSDINLIKRNFENIYTEFWPINYGKSSIFNYLINFLKDKDYTYIIYLDHDIHFDLNSTDNFVNIFSKDLSKYGLIAFNQKGDIRHQANIYENKENNIVWPNDDTSIASGAFLIKSDIFTELNKFDKIVYGLDDYYLCKQLREKGYLNIVISNCFVMHPFDKNDKYLKWKRDSIERLVKGEKMDYFREIEEVNNLFLI